MRWIERAVVHVMQTARIPEIPPFALLLVVPAAIIR